MAPPLPVPFKYSQHPWIPPANRPGSNFLPLGVSDVELPIPPASAAGEVDSDSNTLQSPPTPWGGYQSRSHSAPELDAAAARDMDERAIATANFEHVDTPSATAARGNVFSAEFCQYVLCLGPTG